MEEGGLRRRPGGGNYCELLEPSEDVKRSFKNHKLRGGQGERSFQKAITSAVFCLRDWKAATACRDGQGFLRRRASSLNIEGKEEVKPRRSCAIAHEGGRVV